MNCQKIKRLLSIYIDGELERSNWPEVKNHLSICGSCARELEGLRKQSSRIKELFASIKVPALSPDFERKFYAQLAQLEEKGHWWEIDWLISTLRRHINVQNDEKGHWWKIDDWLSPYQQPILAGVAMACLLLAVLFYPKGDGIKVVKDKSLPLIVREAVFEGGRLSEQGILKSQAEDIVSRLL